MSLKQLEAEILALPKDSLAELLARLLAHLNDEREIDRELEKVWIQEAEERDREIDTDRVIGISAEEVFQQLRAEIQ
ncbi:MAG: addiction module protein [Cyanobacteriota bacterium]|nr:addiction module protein [Cyanobacteriota bacterium]